ncbi:MAG: hypothetical protein Q4G09_00165 [Clostridia bacterium]|nr:hypothetical protein [Clostridia bacterium]
MNKNINFGDLTKEELLSLLVYYNNYVQEYPETHNDGMYPVSINDFYDNEYQEIIENQKKQCEDTIKINNNIFYKSTIEEAEKISNNNTVYRLEVGVICNNTEGYNGHYDENVIAFLEKEKAIQYAKNYIKNGVDLTYASIIEYKLQEKLELEDKANILEGGTFDFDVKTISEKIIFSKCKYSEKIIQDYTYLTIEECLKEFTKQKLLVRENDPIFEILIANHKTTIKGLDYIAIFEFTNRGLRIEVPYQSNKSIVIFPTDEMVKNEKMYQILSYIDEELDICLEEYIEEREK